MEGLNTTFGVFAIIASLVIVGYLVFARRKVGELQYRWETGTWPHSGSPAIDGLRRWEDEHNVADLDSAIARVEAEIVKATEAYKQRRLAVDTTVTFATITQLEEQQRDLVDRRKHRIWLTSVAGFSATPVAAVGPPKLPDDNQPVNGKVSEPARLVAASKS